VRRNHPLMDSPATVYLRKCDPDQPFWQWVVVNDDRPIPVPLRFLVAENKVLCGVEGAQRVLDYLAALGFGETEPGTARMPVEVMDGDGNLIARAELAAAA
jgi:hypothetical protein